MQALTLFMIVVVTTFEFLTNGDLWGNWAVLPNWAPYLAELLGAVALVYVLLAGTRSRFQFVRPAYWFVFGALVVAIGCGVVVNNVGSGPVFAGIRNYLRAMPWFFVPAIFAFSERQIRIQFRLLLVIAVIQVPLAIQQRIASMGGGIGAATGDWTIGTITTSGALSIFMICCTCVVAAMFVRKQLTPQQSIILAVMFLIPTTINETKATLVLLPIGLWIAFLVAAKPGNRLRYALAALAGVLLFVTIFVPTYDYMNREREYAVPLTEMLSDPERLERYLSHGKNVGSTGEVGKLDTVVVPFQRFRTEPLHLAFGYGIGNVSNSALGRGFVGRYFDLYAPFVRTAFGQLVLELGALGLGLILIVMWLVYRDSRAVARRPEGLMPGFAAGWSGVVAVMVLSMPYTNAVAITPLAFLFWYFSGLVAADRMRSVLATRSLPRSDEALRISGAVRT